MSTIIYTKHKNCIVMVVLPLNLFYSLRKCFKNVSFFSPELISTVFSLLSYYTRRNKLFHCLTWLPYLSLCQSLPGSILNHSLEGPCSFKTPISLKTEVSPE